MSRICAAAVLALVGASAQASFIYTFDFPGDPGSGLVVDQTAVVPDRLHLTDFTRTGVSAAPGFNIFNSAGWSTATTLDATQYISFSLTGEGWLNLTQLSLGVANFGSGAANGEVALFLNGSATAYSIQDFTISAIPSQVVFNFSPVLFSDEITSAEFRIYGWNSTPGGTMRVDDVQLAGDVSPVPESSTVTAAIFIGVIICGHAIRQRRRALATA